MPHEERTGKRSLTYSEWHRVKSIRRFAPEVVAARLTMIDIDGVFVEAKHPYDRKPVALVETVETGKSLKPTDYYYKNVNILYQLGKAANVPVFLVLYKPDHATRNPAAPDHPDIAEFYIKEWWPNRSKKWKVCNPKQYANFLICLRQSHIEIKRNGPQLRLPFDDYSQELSDDDLERYWYASEFMKKEFAA